MSSKNYMFAKVVLASRPTNGAPPIITIHARYPRFIHSELMTHRDFSRNARSSRAVPVATMLEEIRTCPVVPWHWGKNQKGMQASEECNEPVLFDFEYADTGVGVMPVPASHTREQAWLAARDNAVDVAEAYMEAGYHKQVVNRLLEPFMWIDTLITSTKWANFHFLRNHKDAEPHFHDLAIMINDAIEGAEYQELHPGEWHLPYVKNEDILMVEDYLEPYPESTHATLPYLQALSVARCARISYAPFDGNPSMERELERYGLLVGSEPLHASPTEHQATPDEGIQCGDSSTWMNPGLGGNLGLGWIQYRKTLPNEYVGS